MFIKHICETSNVYSDVFNFGRFWPISTYFKRFKTILKDAILYDSADQIKILK